MTTDDSATVATEPDNSSKAKKRKGFSLRSKLLMLLLTAGMSAAVLMAYLGFYNGEKAITENTFARLTALRSSKKNQLEWYFSNLRNTFRILGETPSVRDALQEFQQGFFTVGLAGLTKKSRKELEKYYDDEYLARLALTSPGKPIREIFWPRSPSGRSLQSLFISGNKNKLGEKDALFKPSGDTVYGDSHAKFHGWFRDIQRRLKFYDIFLIDGTTGSIVYSVFKEADFGTNLLKGPYAYTNLGRLFQNIKNNHRKGYVKMEDFSSYPPSYNGPAMFIGTPIYSFTGKFIGVLAAQLSIGEFSNFMGSAKGLDEWGIGTTGDVYLVGEDGKMRSDSRFLYKNKREYLKSLAALGVPDKELNLIATVTTSDTLPRSKQNDLLLALKDTGVTASTFSRIASRNTSVLYERSDTEAGLLALTGQTGTRVIANNSGVPVLSSFTPLDIPDLRWALVAEQHESEARSPQRAFVRQVIIATCLLLLALSMASLWLATRFLKPIRTLIEGVERVRRGDKNYKIENTRGDEFGDLMDAFNRRSGEMRQMEYSFDRQADAHDSLLRRMFPDFVADRLKKGDDRIVDSFHQVSVIYVIIQNFSGETEHLAGEEAIDLLNEIVNSFDDAGVALGIEKVKTIGEHYLAVCGLSVARLDHARRSVDFCHEIGRELALFNARHGMTLALRMGIHSGPLHAGLIGSRNLVYDIWGTSLNIARRIVVDADLNTMRISTHTFHMLNKKDGFGEEVIVDTKALGKIATYEQALDMAVDENRLGLSGQENREPKSKTASNGEPGPGAKQQKKSQKAAE